MASSYTTRNGILKQGTGDNTNTWGDQQSTGDFDVLDYSLDGLATPFDPTGGVSISLTNASTSGAANARMLKLITATTTATVTLPSREHWYIVWNATTAAQTIACGGGGSSISVAAGEIIPIMCDAVNVKRLTVYQMANALDMGSHKITSVTDPTNAQDVATKAYADALAFASFAGTFPAQTGNAGKFTKTDGSAVSWQSIATTDISDLATYTATRNAFAVAMAIAL